MFRMVVVGVLLALSAVGVEAAEHEVRMVTTDAGEMLFTPDFVKAASGDTIRFVSVDPTHNAETIKGMLPEGAEAFKGEISEALSVTLTEEGVYGIMCKSHYALGMVMLVVVGEPENLAQAMKRPHPLKARHVFTRHFSGMVPD